jgi:prepilin-type N-terminal cleavage/methylation domain-containing protein
MTRAPRSASSWVAKGPATARVKSRTRRFERGPVYMANRQSYQLARIASVPRQFWYMKQKLRGFSLIELLIVIAIISALAALVAVSAKTILKNTRETAALAHVQTLQKAQTQFYSMRRRFAASLTELGPSKAKLIADHLAAGTLGGYVFTVTGNEEAFTVKARPERPGQSGDISYFVDESAVIRSSAEGEANQDSPPFK